MRCQRCKHERAHGAYYQCYMGVAYPSTGAQGARARRMRYAIQGPRKLWICHRCVAKSVLTSEAGLGALVLLLFQLSGQPEWMLFGIFAGLLLIASYIADHGWEIIQTCGDAQAIRAVQAEMGSGSHYDIYLDRGQVKRLD
ncbi:MAG: hypothetical protein Kow00124_29760 [Anaerolineae bacterium]